MAEPNDRTSAGGPAEQSLRESHALRESQALRESEALYRLLAENSSDVISRHKLSGQWLYLSPAVRGLLGHEPAALVGQDPFEHIHPEDRTRAAEVLARLVLSKEPQSATFRIRRADGVYIWSETVGRVVVSPVNGELLEIVATSRDVTERVEASRKLRNREAELAHASRLSTMGQMATEIAHELNQPLYAIANFADACLTLASRQAPPPDPDLLHWLELIKQQARRAGDVLRRVTQFVRKGEVHPVAVDLNELIRDVLSMLDLEFRQQRVATRVELAEPLPLVLADRLLIEQVVVNLVRNAVEALAAADAGLRELRIFTRQETEGVVITVCDSGPGLTEAQLAGVFEPYFTTKNDGTGLGLAICRSTIEAHDGKIWARNHAQGGAEFAFLLPLAPAGSAEKLE